MNYDDQLDYEYIIHCLKTENNRLLRSVRRLKAEQTIDEGCVGCAGPCKVVDVSANLQKELDATRGMYFAGQEYIAKQNAEIRRRDAELHDLKMYQPDNFWAVVTERDSMIRRQGKIIEDFKTIETRETDRLHKIIDELKDQNIADLKELYDLDKEDIEDLRSQLTDCKKIDCHNAEVFKKIINGLEAELSARKEDSLVLKKVVEAVRRYDLNELVYAADVLRMIYPLLEDYLNAPEGSPETPINDDQDIAIVFTFGEIL